MSGSVWFRATRREHGETAPAVSGATRSAAFAHGADVRPGAELSVGAKHPAAPGARHG